MTYPSAVVIAAIGRADRRTRPDEIGVSSTKKPNPPNGDDPQTPFAQLSIIFIEIHYFALGVHGVAFAFDVFALHEI
jgi:hypothetical protein